MAEIALCLSGGGYRAAVYHLGVLSYLHHVCPPTGGRLIDHVHTMTSISGGALPAFAFALANARNIDRVDSFKELYKSLVENNLGDQMLEHFNHSKDPEKSFIKSLAFVYSQVFFKDAKFGEIIDMMQTDEMHHFSVDATDFELGIPFRFQATAELNIPDRDEPYGVIGNRTHKIERNRASEIRISDIMAATSCFPLAFEPIVYPTDFQFQDLNMRRLNNGAEYLLMDGGLVDNQGVDPMNHAEWHLSAIEKHHDLVILSDAGNKPIKKEEKPIKWSKHSLMFWNIIAIVFSVILVLASLYLYQMNSFFYSGLTLMGSVSVFAVMLIVNLIMCKLKDYICDNLQFQGNFTMMWFTGINEMITFLKARATTVYRMVDFVMMGHIKKVAYRELSGQASLKSKVLMNSLPVLSNGGKWDKILRRRNHPDRSLTPSKALKRNTKKANTMKTTLWFTWDEKVKGIPLSLLACGQYTTCWNLLQHIDRIKALPEEERSEGQKMIISLEPILKGDWDRFNANPLILANSYSYDR